MSLVLFLLGAALIFGGANYLRGKSVIFADIANPPTPADPVAVENPPSPENLTGEFTFAPGWTLVSGRSLAGRDLSALKGTELVLYSFNDPAYPTRVWSTYPDANDSATSIIPHAPFGYYVYNPGTSSTDITFATSSQTVSDEEMIARGWHLLYWPGDTTSLSGLLSQINMKYSDGVQMTAFEATSSQNHRASIDINVIVNGTSSDVKTAVKVLGNTDSDTAISKIPAKSYFWLYFRRTTNRVVNISIPSSVSSGAITTATTTATATGAYPVVTLVPTDSNFNPL